MEGDGVGLEAFFTILVSWIVLGKLGFLLWKVVMCFGLMKYDWVANWDSTR